jgi:hypothetical protein
MSAPNIDTSYVDSIRPKNLFQRKSIARSKSTSKNAAEAAASANEPKVLERPVFTTQKNAGTAVTRKGRAVAIPYSRFRKERFYDWPPDPTVSRATPLPPFLKDTANLDASLQDPVISPAHSYGKDGPVETIIRSRPDDASKLRHRGASVPDIPLPKPLDEAPRGVTYPRSLDETLTLKGKDGSSHTPSQRLGRKQGLHDYSHDNTDYGYG